MCLTFNSMSGGEENTDVHEGRVEQLGPFITRGKEGGKQSILIPFGALRKTVTVLFES
jgi:hypothetical protein